MKIRLIFDRHAMTATLYDNPSAGDFASMLPLDLEIDDFGSNEKIAYLSGHRLVHQIGHSEVQRLSGSESLMPMARLSLRCASPESVVPRRQFPRPSRPRLAASVRRS